MCAGTFGTAGDCSEIADISYPVKYNDQWSFTFRNVVQHFVYIDIIDGRGYTDSSLMIASGEVVEFLDRHPLNADMASFAKSGQFVQQDSVCPFFEVNFFKFVTCLNSFNDRA